MQIRAANKKDFKDFYKLESQYVSEINRLVIKDLRCSLDKSGLKKSFLKKLNMKNKKFLVLHDNKKLYGYIFGYVENLNKNRAGYKFKADRIGYLENVFIVKKYRGKGYFSQLMKHFIDFLEKENVKNCTLHVSIKNNAVGIYEKMKFKKDEYKMIMKVK